jgi:hypothetical protein
VITSVKQVNADVVEIKRKMVYKSDATSVKFDKESPNEETITIDRSKINRRPTDVVMESIANFGFKHQLVRLYGFGYMLKRQLLNKDAHKAFEDERALRLIRDVFMYKNMKECNMMYKILDPHQSRFRPSKDNLKELSHS